MHFIAIAIATDNNTYASIGSLVNDADIAITTTITKSSETVINSINVINDTHSITDSITNFTTTITIIKERYV